MYLIFKVRWIVQAHPPSSIAEYIHRVGRTARLEASGRALLLLLPSEVQFVAMLGTHALRYSVELLISFPLSFGLC